MALYGGAASGADPYLEALESEAAGIEVDPASRPRARGGVDSGAPSSTKPDAASTDWDVELQQLDAALPRGLSQEAFERALKAGSYSTFALYRKLGARDRKTVYAFYRDHPTVGEIRSEIIQRLAGH